MWRRKRTVPLVAAAPRARKRRRRFRRRAIRPTTVRRYERAPRDDAPSVESVAVDGALLEQDSVAFVEAIALPPDAGLRARRQRDALRASLDFERATAEVDALADDLDAAERALEAGDYSRLSMLRRLRSRRRPQALKEQVQEAQLRLTRKLEEVEEKRVRAEVLERDAREPDGGVATLYRLHSGDHFLTCSKGQYEHLHVLQRTKPVLLTTRKQLRWWWYRDRFWWSDQTLGPREIASTILNMDHASQYQREAFERAQAGLFGLDGHDETVPEHVRREVWIRDLGRCVDCGVDAGLAFDYILLPAVGGATTVANLELRCGSCRQQRRSNESKATVGKARIGADAAKKWGVQLKDQSWPRTD